MTLLGIDGIASLVQTVVNKIFPDAGQMQKDKFALALQESLQQFQLDKGQMNINQVEAASSSLFVSGWRPFVAWTCGFSFGWNYVLHPLFDYFVAVSGHPIPALPVLDMDIMVPVLGGLLGLGTMRTVERVKGVGK